MTNLKVEEKVVSTSNAVIDSGLKKKSAMQHSMTNLSSVDTVSFTGGNSNLVKKGLYLLRRISEKMKDITEFHNAVIAAIGTGIIAPLVILASPGKGDKKDKDKKRFQALRQPLSAVLALGFQVPATMAVNNIINKFAFEKHAKFFRDDAIGELVPDKKYFAKNASKEEIATLDAEFEKVVDGHSLRQELEDQIRKDFKEVDSDISDKKLAKEVENRKGKFLKDKIGEQKYKEAFEAKLAELAKDTKLDIKDIDLVSENYKTLAKDQRFKADYEAIREEMHLNWFDEFLDAIGLQNNKLKELEKKQKDFAKVKGLELLKETEPEIATNKMVRLRNFLESAVEKSHKTLDGKKFWLSLLVNLFMVTASCYALNWAHPRVKELIDLMKNKNVDTNNSFNKKAEVK